MGLFSKDNWWDDPHLAEFEARCREEAERALEDGYNANFLANDYGGFWNNPHLAEFESRIRIEAEEKVKRHSGRTERFLRKREARVEAKQHVEDCRNMPGAYCICVNGKWEWRS